MRILYTGGGTGGHIYPLLAVKDEIEILGKQSGVQTEFYYLGAPGMFLALLQSAGISVFKILPVKIRRYFDVKNFLVPPKLVVSLFQAFWRMFLIMPDVVFSKGGPGALETVIAAKFFRIPVIIHESDTVPGAANRLSAKRAKTIFIAFPSAAAQFSDKVQDRIFVAGNPVRRSLIKNISESSSAKRIFGLDEKIPVILVIGGSQGAEKINDMILDVLPELVKDCQIIHVCGVENYERVKQESDLILKENIADKNNSQRYKLMPYLEQNYGSAFAAADLIISRAGSGSIFEIAAFGKPSILIPLAGSAKNHQTKNAYEYAKNGAAVVVEEENMTPNMLLSQISKIFSDEESRRKMSESALAFFNPESAEIIAKEIIKIYEKR